MRIFTHLLVGFMLVWAPLLGAQVSLDYMPRESGDLVSLQYIVDAHGDLRINEVQSLASTAWKSNPPGRAVFGFTDSRYWFMGLQTKVSHAPGRQFLEIPNPLLGSIDLFIVVTSPGHEAIRYQYRLGAQLPFDERPIKHPNFVVPIELPANATFKFYAGVETNSSMQVPVRIWNEPDFHAHSNMAHLANGIYVGILLALLVYHLALLVLFRDPLYWLFCLWTMSIGAFSLCINGLAFEFVWPASIEWNGHATVLFTMLTAGFWLTYAIEFIKPADSHTKPYARLQQLTLIFTALALTLSLLLPYRVSIHAAIGMELFALIVSIHCAYKAMKVGVRQARLFIGSVAVLLFAGVLYLLAKFGLLPNSLLIDNMLQITIVLEAVCLSVAMATRFSAERRERLATAQQLKDFQALTRQQLEAHVTDRTHQLEETNRKLSQLSVTDGLTGLLNRRYLDNNLELEVGRAMLAGKPLALAMVDIDRFKGLNDTYGHAAGDICLRLVAKELQKQVPRSSDWVARYGGEEFCVVMPNTDANGAMVVAERIRRAMLGLRIDVGQQLISVTVSVGVCCAIPRHKSSLQRMQEEVDQALYQAKQSGRNKVVMSPWPSESA